MTRVYQHQTIYDYSLTELESLLRSWGEPAYRGRQIYRQLYAEKVANYKAMTDLPIQTRNRFRDEIPFTSLHHISTRIGDQGLTRKALFNTPQNEPVEAVLMIYSRRATVCVSAQSGCAIRCIFCATGQMGFCAHLTAGQMIEQVLWACRELQTAYPGRKLTNVVYMGMGEPFLNYEAWWQSVQRLHDAAGFNLGARSFTVSTVGILPGIVRLADEPLRINLAVSLHAANDTLRSRLVPINRKYPLRDLLAAVRTYTVKTGRRITFEYVLLEGVNDRLEHAQELADFCQGKLDNGKPLLCHINLIPWNRIASISLHPANKRRVREFQRVLEQAHISCTLRAERGIGIAAACGQLQGIGNPTPS